jgi:F-type H+-transporting ATPase subunit delta
LLAVGNELGSSRSFLDEIDALTGEVIGSDPLRRVLFAPVHPRAERKAVLRDVCERLGSSREVRAFAALLVDENRTSLLPSIRDALRELVEREEGKVVAQVTTARKLDKAESRALAGALSRRVGAKVTLSLEVDESILGGVVARIGNLLLDGSVRTQLASLAGSLRRGTS